MMKPDLTRWAPPGLKLKPEKQFFVMGMVCAVLYSFGFFVRYSNARSNLYSYDGIKRVLRPDYDMPDFYTLLGGFWLGFAVLAICMLALIVYHYAYHRQGSRSIYLMRRLPNRFELHRRCLTLPFVAILLCLLAVMILFFVFYAVYMTATPKECLTPFQWQKIWSVIR